MILSVTARKEKTPKSVVATEIIFLMNCSLFALAFQGDFQKPRKNFELALFKIPR